MRMLVQIDGQSFEVDIGDLSSRPIEAVIDGQVFNVWPEEPAAPAPVAGGEPAAVARSTTSPPAAGAGERQADVISSPLPGDVVGVAVQPGDTVTAGQLLCTVESMKMNNPVRSPRPGTVDEVFVRVGSHVNHGDPLVRLRPGGE